MVVVEWQATTEHHVENDTATPDVNFWSSVESANLREQDVRQSPDAVTYFPEMTSGAA